MKKLMTVLPVIALTVLLSGYAQAAYDDGGTKVSTFSADVDYSEAMIQAAVTGDYEAGLAAQQTRDEKIAALGLDAENYTFEDLMLLSKIIYAEAGSVWLSDEWKMCVGEVVLNRVASPEFPDTIKEVLEQPGQYYGENSRYFDDLLPTDRCVRCAVRLLNGERQLEPSVVFQANFKQGSGTHTAVYDKFLGWTYFCYSSHTELY
ncbi:MAG: cell wall hydrolase [Oscillospiraceae bacterium]|nr:cell wall hydrolase [Oscillospiraceae bacterium]